MTLPALFINIFTGYVGLYWPSLVFNRTISACQISLEGSRNSLSVRIGSLNCPVLFQANRKSCHLWVGHTLDFMELLFPSRFTNCATCEVVANPFRSRTSKNSFNSVRLFPGFFRLISDYFRPDLSFFMTDNKRQSHSGYLLI